MFHKLNEFSWLFVSERKQIALMADEKPSARISHRLFVTSRSEMRIKMKTIAFLLLLLYDFFIWTLCKACSIADERENFDGSY